MRQFLDIFLRPEFHATRKFKWSVFINPALLRGELCLEVCLKILNIVNRLSKSRLVVFVDNFFVNYSCRMKNIHLELHWK